MQDKCRGYHPKQSWVTQFNESDADFICRWLAQESISWYFEHGDDGAPGEHPKLTLVLFDDVSVLNASNAGKVRFHRDDGTENEDVITQWHGKRALQSGSTQRSSYEYKAVAVNTRQDENRADQGDYARYGKLRAQAHEYATKCFTGHGTHRELTVGIRTGPTI